MTQSEVESLKLGIAPIDDRVILIVESGVDWLKENTTINCDDLTNLPACARLFLTKFFDLQLLNTGVSSESIEGLSQSFDNTDKSALLWQFAEELLYPYLISRVRFVEAQSRWDYGC